MGTVITSASLTAIGAVLDYCRVRPQNTDQEITFDERPADPCVLLAEKITEFCQSDTPPALMECIDNGYRGEGGP